VLSFRRWPSGLLVVFGLVAAAGCASAPPASPVVEPQLTLIVPRTALRGQWVHPTVYCSNAGPLKSLAWNWGDGQQSTTLSSTANHRYERAGVYTIEAVETTVDGLETRGIATVTVYAP